MSHDVLTRNDELRRLREVARTGLRALAVSNPHHPMVAAARANGHLTDPPTEPCQMGATARIPLQTQQG